MEISFTLPPQPCALMSSAEQFTEATTGAGSTTTALGTEQLLGDGLWWRTTPKIWGDCMSRARLFWVKHHPYSFMSPSICLACLLSRNGKGAQTLHLLLVRLRCRNMWSVLRTCFRNDRLSRRFSLAWFCTAYYKGQKTVPFLEYANMFSWGCFSY